MRSRSRTTERTRPGSRLGTIRSTSASTGEISVRCAESFPCGSRAVAQVRGELLLVSRRAAFRRRTRQPRLPHSGAPFAAGLSISVAKQEQSRCPPMSRRGRTARLSVIDDVLTSPASEQIKELRIERQLDNRSPSSGPPRVIPASERANQASRQIRERSDDRKPKSFGSSPNASSSRAPTARARKPRAVRSRLARLLPRPGLR